MIMANSQQSFYEKYWIERGQQFCGDQIGYAPNLRRWMSENPSQLTPEARSTLRDLLIPTNLLLRATKLR